MKKFGLVIVVILLILGGFWLFRQAQTDIIALDTIVDGDFQIEAGKRLAFENGATLTVRGNLEIVGEIEGDDQGVAIVANSVTLGADAEIESGGNVQLVESAEFLARSEDEVNKLYDEAGLNSGDGPRVGPLSESEELLGSVNLPLRGGTPTKQSNSTVPGVLKKSFLIPTVRAQGPAPVVIGGKISVATPPPGVKRIVLFHFPGSSSLEIKDLDLEGPDGRDGASHKGESCNAKGDDGEDAFRFMAVAGNLKVGNFNLKLGSGGNGGDAETTRDCDPGTATGGRGGKSGNFKMIAAQGFEIVGEFIVVPGSGGKGGEAKAFGKEGKGPGEKGGDATATGGRGADNKKSLNIQGTVGGASNVQFASTYGGRGGDATADPGKGGDGKGCGSNGGPGGKGTSTGGRGGDASLTVSGGAIRTPEAEDHGGEGGDADSHGGKGGAGGSCDEKGPGGAGGSGGDAKSTLGKGGIGVSSNGTDGLVSDETGGNGGSGGDGCPEGAGGKGGAGKPPGKDGAQGKNLCKPPTPATAPDRGTGTQISPTPTPNPTPPPISPSSGRPIQVIQFNGKYLPVEQLIVEDEQGCDGGTAHYHAAQGVVIATDGTPVPDPGPQCGYGKVSERSVITIQLP